MWQTIEAGKNFGTSVRGALLDIQVTLRPDDAKRCGIIARGVPIAYDAQKKALTCGKETAPVALVHGVLRLRVLVDRGSIEVFANDGRVALVAAALPRLADTGVELFAGGGAARAQNFSVAVLRSAWSRE